MSQVIRAALTYFALAFGAGFLLGAVRVPFLVPRLGERWAELLEMPIMAAVIFFAAGQVLRTFPQIRLCRRSLAVGFLALAFMVCAEIALAVALQSRTLVEYVTSRDEVSGSVYLGMLVVFALMPRLRLANQASSDGGRGGS